MYLWKEANNSFVNTTRKLGRTYEKELKCDLEMKYIRFKLLLSQVFTNTTVFD